MALVHSLTRRPETYHTQLRNLPAKSPDHVQSIHDQTRTKEDGLERWLQYDRWPQQSFRLLLFGMGKTGVQDCSSVHLEEDAALATGNYKVSNLSPLGATLTSCDSADWTAEKTLSLSPPRTEGFRHHLRRAGRAKSAGNRQREYRRRDDRQFSGAVNARSLFRNGRETLSTALDGGRSGHIAARGRRMAARGSGTRRTRSAEFLGRADRDGIGIGGRLRARVSGIEDYRRLAGGAGSRSGMEEAIGIPGDAAVTCIGLKISR